jgi:hypothetical protein
MIILVFDNKLKHFIELIKKLHVGKFANFIQYQRILSESQSSATPVDVINHLRIYNIEINSIGTSEIDAHYLLIEGKFDRIEISEIRIFYLAVQRTNILTFWDAIWNRNVSSIVMLYEINENVEDWFD